MLKYEQLHLDSNHGFLKLDDGGYCGSLIVDTALVFTIVFIFFVVFSHRTWSYCYLD